MSFATGHAHDSDGSTLDEVDRDGVTCHFCHSMVDPIYRPGESPTEDQSILEALDEVPGHYANAMFVLDPSGLRRGPYQDTDSPHETLYSPFHRSGNLCGTCHDVGNVAVSRQENGTYRYNAIDSPTPNEDPHTQFPLERTFTEWRLSEFADTRRRHGWALRRHRTVRRQHLPGLPHAQDHGLRAATSDDSGMIWLATTSPAPPPRCSTSSPSCYKDDPSVDQAAIAAGRAKSISMLERAASLDLAIAGELLSRACHQPDRPQVAHRPHRRSAGVAQRSLFSMTPESCSARVRPLRRRTRPISTRSPPWSTR